MLAGCQLLYSLMESSPPYKYLTVSLLLSLFSRQGPKVYTEHPWGVSELETDRARIPSGV